jgi:hypothetical protein
MREGNYQTQLIKKLEYLFPGSLILKNDPNYIQGLPDLIVLYDDQWAALEVKSNPTQVRPNQRYFVERMDDMSFARFISPETEEEVLNDLQQAFNSHRSTRVSRR